jgi:hypothetical protein
MTEEISILLKNAVERGQPLDVAVQSLINAGYSASIVREAASSMSNSVTPMLTDSNYQFAKSNQITKQESTPIAQPSPQTPALLNNKEMMPTAQNPNPGNLPVFPGQKPQSRTNKIVITLIIVLIMLIIILGVSYYFKDQILDWVSTLTTK